MGLDDVELLMEVEDEFEIRIPDEEATRVVSVRDLYECVQKRRGAKPPSAEDAGSPPTAGGCPTARAFYLLREALRQMPDLRLERVRPSTTLDALFPAGRRVGRVREALTQVPLETAVPHAGLSCRRCVWWPAVSIASVSLVVAIVLALLDYVAVARVLAFPMLALCLVVPLAIEFCLGWTRSFGDQTVGDTAHGIVALNRPHFGITSQYELDDDIWPRLRTIISKQIDRAEEQIHPDQQFYRDLDF